MARLHARRQSIREISVPLVVAHMDEYGPPGTYALGLSHGVIDCQMHGVGSIAQGIQNQNVQVFQQGKAGLRDPAHIGQIGKASDPEPVHRKSAMDRRNRGHRDAALAAAPIANPKRSMYFPKVQPGHARVGSVAKNVSEHGAKYICRFGMRVTRNARSTAEEEWA